MSTKKVVINRCFGGFSMSYEAVIKIMLREKGIQEYYIYADSYDDKSSGYTKINLEELCAMRSINNVYLSTEDLGDVIEYDTNKSGLSYISPYEYNSNEYRSNKNVIDVLEELGLEKADGMCSDLKIVEIPEDVDYVIDDYDGMETIHEKHRVWK